MKPVTEILTGQHVLMIAVAATLAAMLLRRFRPELRRDLYLYWGLLVLGLIAQAGAVAASWLPNRSLAAIMAAAATVLVLLAVIQLSVLLIFRLLLPAGGIAPPRIAQDLAFTGLAMAWGLVWLNLMGVDASQIFTTSAILTAVVAFAMQDTLGNVLGGVVLQLDYSLRVGEWVRIDDISGRVVDVRWRHTAIETRNRETVVIPNSWLMKNRFTVMRRRPDESLLWRRTVHFNIDAKAAPATVIRTLQQAVADAHIDNLAAEPAANAILLDASSGYYRYALRYWLSDPQYDEPTDSQVRVHALAALARAGISLGLPQEERLMIKENEHWRQAIEQNELQNRLEALQRTALFAALPQSELQVLAHHLVRAPFVKGGVMTRQGAVAHWLYLIVKGQAQVSVQEADTVTPIATLADGDFFGEMGMLTGDARRATVVALTDVECYRLDKVGFAEVLLARPELAKDISAILTRRREDMDSLIRQAKNTQPRIHPDDLLAKIKSFFGINGSGG